MAYEYKGYNPKNSKHVQKYMKEHYKSIALSYKKEDADAIKAFAESKGMSVAGFIKQAIKEAMERG